MIDGIITVILVAICALLNILFVKSLFPKGRFSSFDIVLVLFLIIENTIAALLLSNYVIVKALLNLISIIIVTKIVFDISFKRSIIVNLLFFGTFTAMEFVALIIFEYVSDVNSYDNLTNSNGAAVLEIICYLIMLIIITILSAKRKKSFLSRLDMSGWLAFVMYPIVTFTLVALLLYLPTDKISQSVFCILIIFAVSMLFLSIMQFFLIDNIIQRETEIQNKQALIDQAEHIHKMYQSLSEEREMQKSKAHDYLNHLNVMLSLAERDNKKEEIDYIKEQIGNATNSVDIIDTGNVVINAVLNIKYREARKKNIIMPLIADDLSCISISECDIVTILSNILDNAIEAAEQCNNKKIVLKITKQDNKLFIDSSNTYNGNLFPLEKRFTTKSDADNHGYGIANIRQTVSRNNGECIIDAKQGIFRISITIPML